jgi:hypothetical protein
MFSDTAFIGIFFGLPFDEGLLLIQRPMGVLIFKT